MPVLLDTPLTFDCDRLEATVEKNKLRITALEESGSS